MKKRMLLALAMAALLAVNTSAMKAVGNVDVPMATPVIDGEIGADEWADAGIANFSAATAKAWAGEFPANFNTDVKVLWDAEGLYFAGEIVEPTLVPSADGTYNGDGFQISIDMGQVFFDTTEARAIFYSFGYNENGNDCVQRQESGNDTVMNSGDGVELVTFKTAKGWGFELMMAWDTLVDDVKFKSGKDMSPAEGFKLNLQFCYMDRDDTGNVTAAIGTTLNDESVAYDWGPKEHGVTLTLGAAPVVETEAVVEDVVVDTATAPATFDATAIAAIAAVVTAAGAVVAKKRH